MNIIRSLKVTVTYKNKKCKAYFKEKKVRTVFTNLRTYFLLILEPSALFKNLTHSLMYKTGTSLQSNEVG